MIMEKLTNESIILELSGMVNAICWTPTGHKIGRYEQFCCAFHDSCGNLGDDEEGRLAHHPECRVALLIKRDPIAVKDMLNKRIIELERRLLK